MKRRVVWAPLMAIVLAPWARLAYADTAQDLQTAIIRDDYVRVRALLEQGVNPNSVDERGRPALAKAIQLGSLRVAQELLKAPTISVNDASPAGETALMHACIKGELFLVRQLLLLGAAVNQPGWSALHYVASSNAEHSVTIAKLLLTQRAAVNALSPNQSTPLMLAAQYGSQEMVELLLRSGADVQLRNQLGLSAVDFARRSDRAFMVERLSKAFEATRRPAGSW